MNQIYTSKARVFRGVQLADRLRNDNDLRRRIMDVFEKRGMTQQEAEARYERVADIAEIAAIPPSQRTDEQKATMRHAESDPTAKEDMQLLTKMAREDVVAPKTGLSGHFSEAVQLVTSQYKIERPPETQPRPETSLAGPGF